MEYKDFNYRQYLLDTGHATDDQIAKLRSFGWRGGGLLTMSKERADVEIADSIARNLKREETKENLVTCWECGCAVHIEEATYDGNGWYCGC